MVENNPDRQFRIGRRQRQMAANITLAAITAFGFFGRGETAIVAGIAVGGGLAQIWSGEPREVEAGSEVLPQLASYDPYSFQNIDDLGNGVLLARVASGNYLALSTFHSAILELTNTALVPVDISGGGSGARSVARDKNDLRNLAVIGTVPEGVNFRQAIRWSSDSGQSWQELRIQDTYNFDNVSFDNQGKIVILTNDATTNVIELLKVDPVTAALQKIALPNVPNLFNNQVLSATNILPDNTQYYHVLRGDGFHELKYDGSNILHRNFDLPKVENNTLEQELKVVTFGGKKHVFSMTPFTEGPEGRGSGTVYDTNVDDNITKSFELLEQYFSDLNPLGTEAQALAIDVANNTLYIGAVVAGVDNVVNGYKRLALLAVKLDDMGNPSFRRRIQTITLPRNGKWTSLDIKDGALIAGIISSETSKSGMYVLTDLSGNWSKVIVRQPPVNPLPTQTITPTSTIRNLIYYRENGRLCGVTRPMRDFSREINCLTGINPTSTPTIVP